MTTMRIIIIIIIVLIIIIIIIKVTMIRETICKEGDDNDTEMIR